MRADEFFVGSTHPRHLRNDQQQTRVSESEQICDPSKIDRLLSFASSFMPNSHGILQQRDPRHHLDPRARLLG